MRLKNLACTALIIPTCAFAARPFVTDDARLTTAGGCQLESWMRIYRIARAMGPAACNPTGNLEFTVGGGSDAPRRRTRHQRLCFPGKTLFRPLETNDWGIGFAVGTIRHPEINPGPNMLGNTCAYIPLSVSLNDDKVILHANLGWLKDKASGQNNLSWGVGSSSNCIKLLGIARNLR